MHCRLIGGHSSRMPILSIVLAPEGKLESTQCATALFTRIE
jgi:hypothetical protein